MTVSRYARVPILGLGTQYGTSYAIEALRSAISNGRIGAAEIIVRGQERLDTIAGEVYGEAKYWWIIAAASNIGWGMQIPPGTILKIPDLGDVASIIG